jgi:type I restriction-modification system DNA methylase subunit
MPTREHFFAKLAELVTLAKDFPTSEFDEAAPEEVTKRRLIEPFFHALGYKPNQLVAEYRIIGDQVDYLVRTERPLLFVEAKSLIDVAPDLFEAHAQQVRRYIRNYRISPQQAEMERPVTWILLTNFAQFHFLRVNEDVPTWKFALDELIPRRDELWELLAPECLEAGRIEELYDRTHKAPLDQRFLADLKRWRLLLANGFAMRNQTRPLADLKLASQQLLDRFLFCRMLETHRLVEHNRLARAFAHYEALYGEADQEKTFAEVLKETLFAEIKRDFNTELFLQPLLCDELPIDNLTIATALGHEPLHAELAAHCGIESGQGQLLPFKHLYGYDFSRMSQDVMGSVYERFLAHNLRQDGGRVVIEDTDELRKKEGIYYTPQYIVDYIVEHTLGEKIKPILAEAKTLLGYKNYQAAVAKIRELSQIKVLDPAMGSGSFLLRAFDQLVGAYADYNTECRRIKKERNGGGVLFDADFAVTEEVLDAPLQVLTENIHGVDLDAQAVEVAKLSLWLRYMAVNRDSFRERLRDRRKGGKPLNLLPTLTRNLKRGNSLIADAKVAGDAAFDWEKEFPEPMIRGGFDVVIGNPPYERIQVIQAHAPEAVEFLKNNYRSAASGNFDIYVCFIERGLQLLNANGIFGYICPNKFFQSEYGQETRQLLSEGRNVSHLVNFGHLQIFSQATIYTCLLFLRRQAQTALAFHKVEDLELWRENGQAAQMQVPIELLTPAEWNFVPGASQPIFEKINGQPHKLEEVADIFVGLQTSADDVFILNYLGETKSTIRLQSQSLATEWTFEKDLLHPLVSGTDVPAYGPLPHRQFIIFPYKVKGDKAELIDFSEIQKKFPKTAEYLSKNQTTLENREGGKFKDGQWHRFGRLQNLTRQAIPKLCVPRLVDQLHAAWDENGEVFLDNVDVGGVTVKSEFEGLKMPYLLALLNSRLLRWFFPFVSVPFRGDYFSANRQFLGQLPIKLIDPKKKTEVKLEKEIVERVEAIQAAHRQCMKLPEVLHRKIAHTQNRTSCNLAHYLQNDFAAAVKSEILIDDVQSTGFVHEIRVETDGKQLTLAATVSDKPDGEPRPLPVLKLTFKDDALRQFIYACWRRFLTEHSRQKKWTKGKKPEPIYPLLVNTLEPLVYFAPAAGDNLRAIRDLMKAVADEAGSSDLAAIESEIQKLDREIDEHVYELYGLTPDEIAVVEGRTK